MRKEKNEGEKKRIEMRKEEKERKDGLGMLEHSLSSNYMK